MHLFYNKLYDNAHNIIGWYSNKGKKNVERETTVTSYASDIDNRGGSILEGGVKILWGADLPIAIRLYKIV